MTHRITALLVVAAMAITACGGTDDAATTTTEPGTTVPPATSQGPDETTAPTEPPATLDPNQVANTSWVVVSFGLDGADDPVLPAAVPTLEFGEDGLAVNGNTGCNSYFGTATLTADTGISFSDLGWTEMACLDPGVMEQEQSFTQALGRVDGFALSATSLVLQASDGSAVIRLVPPAPIAAELPLSGDWRLVTFVEGDVAMSVLAGTEVTLTIDTAAGTLSGNAGCNGFNGQLASKPADEPHTTVFVVMSLASTLMACDPDVMDQEAMFHAVLGDATEAIMDVAFLTVVTGDGRALVFEPA